MAFFTPVQDLHGAMSDSGSEPDVTEEEVANETLSNPDVVTKYKAAAEIANRALEVVLADVKPGVKVADLCARGDKFVEEETAKVFNKAKTKDGAKVEKGSAFPTCVSLNEIVCHYSAEASDARALAEGDWVKIDLGVHIDGYIATVAHTAVCGTAAGPAPPPSGKGGDVLAAAACASELLLRVVRPGHKNSEVPAAMKAVAEAFGVSVVDGVLIHQLKRFVIDGNKVATTRAGTELRAAEVEFEANEVYAVDVAFSSGEGKPRQLDEKATGVYKRALDVRYSVKMKAARALMAEVSKKSAILPFSLRSLGLGVGAAKLGLTECLAHELLHAYPVLHEKPGDCVAHLKATVLLMPNGPDRVTGLPPPPFATDKALEDEVYKPMLTAPLKASKKAAKKAAKREAEGGAAPMAA